jgi:ribosomal-protein-alanine N-acetyltransferase
MAQMTKVELIPIDAALAKALETGPEAMEARYGVRVDEDVEDVIREVVAETLALLARAPRKAPWGCYLARDAATRLVVGTCGFKDGPSAELTVEIAYFTFPPYEGRGCATAMARALMDIAASSPQVRRVIAHAVPERNASTRVLEKLGMRFAGPVEDAEDGTVWRWEGEPG